MVLISTFHQNNEYRKVCIITLISCFCRNYFSFHLYYQQRKTLVTLPQVSDPDHEIDLLDIGHFAHVELEAVNQENYPVVNLTRRELNVKAIAGDNTGTIHIGEKDVLNIEPSVSKHVPFNVIVYQVMRMLL